MEIFSILKIIPAMTLPRFDKGPSGLPFAYSRCGVHFLMCSNMTVDLLENFHEKKLIFSKPISATYV